MSEWIPLRRDATWTAHMISIRPENRRNSWNQYTILLPSLSPPLSPLWLRFVCRARKRGRHEGGRKRATAFFFRIDRRNRKDTNGSKFRRYLVKLLIDRTSSIELKSGHRWEGRGNEVIPLVKLSRGLRGGWFFRWKYMFHGREG